MSLTPLTSIPVKTQPITDNKKNESVKTNIPKSDNATSASLPVKNTINIPSGAFASANIEPKKIDFQPVIQEKVKEKKELIGITTTKANIYSHKDGDKSFDTGYVCGHLFRVATDLKDSKLKYTGFIHMSDKPKEEQYFDVLGTGIKGYTDKLKDKDNITIMATGFTKFDKVYDNPTSNFLFGNGTDTDIDKLGIRAPQKDKIDKMMQDKFPGKNLTSETYSIEQNGKTIDNAGIKYTYKEGEKTKTINLAFVMLPVDDDFSGTETKTNPKGDGTGDMFKASVKTISPDAVISFGAAKNMKSENYNVESLSFGLQWRGAKLYNDDNKYSINNDLSDIFKQQLKK